METQKSLFILENLEDTQKWHFSHIHLSHIICGINAHISISQFQHMIESFHFLSSPTPTQNWIILILDIL